MRTDRFPRVSFAKVGLLLVGSLLTIGFAAVHPAAFGADSAKQPAKKDSRPFLKTKHATLTASVDPTEVAPGGEVTYKVTAKLKPGYHIYAYSKKPIENGPLPTNFDFFDPGGLTISGDWKPSKQPIEHPEPAFDNLVVKYYEDEVTWSIKLKVPADVAAGEHTLFCQAQYMVCDAKSCSPPGQWTLPPVTVTVGGGSAKLDAPAPAPVAAQTSSTPTPPPAEVKPPEPAPATASIDSAVESVESKPVESEIARTAQQGMIPFLIASALGGLFALVMPCVWPMVPITVNFFIKQGQTGSGKTTGLAITYCLAIITIFTMVGVLCSFFFKAASLQTLANNPWLNLGVAALFLAFGLSLLGLFEIRLPSFLLNASAQGEGRGGLVGVIFMALTLTITSFTCTFPVVGGLLVMAGGGDFFYPIIGLATFAAVLALPFFLLALAPGMLSKMPKSGDWMNSVKVVGGLVEIGAALKFINTAELGYVVPEDAWFDAQVILTAWIALSAVCGVYLLGLFKTDHDHDEVKVGPVRLMFGVGFLGFALYMMPALFGRPPESLVWDRLIVGILPPDSREFTAPTFLAAGGAGAGSSAEAAHDVPAVSTDPAQAQREQKSVHGVAWGMSLDQAKELAKSENKPILIDFTGVNCANCRLMERRVLPRPEVVGLLKEFITVQLYTDRVPIKSITSDERLKLAEQNQNIQFKMTADVTNPFYVVLSTSGEFVTAIGGYNEPGDFVSFLNAALGKARDVTKVAQAGGGK